MTDLKRSRINDALYEIHRDITADLSGKRLSQIALYSEQHFHRVFKQQTGESLHRYIRRTRLEQAANQLTFEAQRPIQEVAGKCGFASLSSFSQAFKTHFGLSPGVWRSMDQFQHSTNPPWLADKEIAAAYQRLKPLPLPQPELVNREPVKVAYLRHTGYGRGIRTAWQTLQAWALTEGRDFSGQLGLHHSNPAWVPLELCRYVACIKIDKPIRQRGLVNSLTVPGGLHAAFALKGKYGELLPWISKILEEWLPTSQFKIQTTPAFVHYRENHFLSKDETFDLTFYLPIGIE